MSASIRYAGSPDELAGTVALAWLEELEKSRSEERPFTVAVSGGNISKRVFSALATSVRERGLGLDHVHFFWADERCVPPDDPESNYRMAREHLFAPLGIAENQIHRIRGERMPEVAAAEAEVEVRQIAGRDVQGRTVIDLVLLGMGEDGHVASLFPGDEGQTERPGGVYRAIDGSPKPPPRRVTLTYEALAVARSVWLVVSGEGKEAALRESLSPTGDTPCARVLRSRLCPIVFTDLPSR